MEKFLLLWCSSVAGNMTVQLMAKGLSEADALAETARIISGWYEWIHNRIADPAWPAPGIMGTGDLGQMIAKALGAPAPAAPAPASPVPLPPAPTLPGVASAALNALASGS